MWKKKIFELKNEIDDIVCFFVKGYILFVMLVPIYFKMKSKQAQILQICVHIVIYIVLTYRQRLDERSVLTSVLGCRIAL